MDPKEKNPVETIEEVIEKKDDEKTVEELEAEAKALEEENKKLKAEKETNEIRQNQLRRLEKAKEKNQSLKQIQETVVEKSNDVDVRDLLTLSKLDIQEDSDKAKILKRYKDAGLIASYAEGLDSVGIKAEFDAIDAKNTAQTIIDENADDETALMTKKEIIKRYQTTGEVPNDPKLQEVIAQENLKNMGF